jgi:hypothetical protein
MKKLILIAAFATSLLHAKAQTYSGPESVEYDALLNRYLVSNTTNGSILSVTPGNSPTVFKTGISPAPYGLEIMNGVVYACCGGFIKGYDLQTGALLTNINTGATFLNGITHDNNGNLFATDFSGKRIYRINPSTNSSNIMAQNLVQSPNGILYDEADNRLIFVNWGSNAPIKALNLLDSVVTNIASTNLSNCDGIARDADGNYYISNWGNNSVMKYNSTFSASPSIAISGMNKPADICINTFDEILAIPNTGNNTVVFHSIFEANEQPCETFPFEIILDSIKWENAPLLNADKAIKMPIVNKSDLSFAYPSAKFSFPNGLPNGVSVFSNSLSFEPFASSWNPGDTAFAFCLMNVSQPIPNNTTIIFNVRVSQLLPSDVDTCFFQAPYFVNIPNDTISSVKVENESSIKLFPNPANDFLFLKSDRTVKSLKIIRSDGVLVSALPFPDNNINIENLTSGFYLIILEMMDGKYFQRKLIKR